MDSKALKHCQVATPQDVVKFMWRMVRDRRQNISSVLDLGAGDGRFSSGAEGATYLGYEIDSSKRMPDESPSKRLVHQDVLNCITKTYDLCIGNPPYIRKELIDRPWRDRVINLLASESDGVRPRADANTFVYFLWLALLRTHQTGLVVQLVPFEWVSRPSASPLREFITTNKWSVEVYRFSDDIFDRVLTTAAIVVIDKSKQNAKWRFFTLDRTGQVTATRSPTGTKQDTLEYQNRKPGAYALRGLSPGGQEIYVLTEEQRRLQGLEVERDVCRCITTLRHVDSDQLNLTNDLFKKAFIDAGQPCWLIRSDLDDLSPALSRYVTAMAPQAQQYSTNTIRGESWFRYRIHPVPDILVASGFRANAPKSFINGAAAVALGSVYGVFIKGRDRHSVALKALRTFDFESQVVAHSNGLRKIEVKQLNSVLSRIVVA